MKRIVLFLVTNLAVMVVLSIVLRLFGLDQVRGSAGRAATAALLAFSAVVGFGGAIISLLMSKTMAKWSTGAHVIDAAVERGRGLARRDRAPARAEGRHRHAGSRDLRRRSQRVRDGRVQEFRAGRGIDRPPAVDEQGGGRGGAGPRGRARRERRHGDAHADPGRGQHVRRLPVAHRRGDRRPRGVSHRARHRAGLFHHGDGVPDRVRHPGVDHRRVVLAPARIPRRRRLGASTWGRHRRWSTRCSAWAASSRASCRRR